MKYLCAVLSFLWFMPAMAEITVVMHRTAESDLDKRYEYNRKLLKLSLEKTEEKYGPFKLLPAPRMNVVRTMRLLSEDDSGSNSKIINFVAKLSYDKRFTNEQNMTYAQFPVDLGIVGYRVCFVTQNKKDQLLQTNTLDDLRKFTHGQGRGWADVQILRSNNMKVFEVDGYKFLFPMVANGRFDLFCRGTNELKKEFQNHQHITNLDYDKSLAIVYPLPRFFYSHKSNEAIIKRIEEGLKIAHTDGSLQKLWYEEYGESLEFVNLKKRKIFELSNPLVKDIEFDYQQYFFDPLK